jgi:hypothetical protein
MTRAVRQARGFGLGGAMVASLLLAGAASAQTPLALTPAAPAAGEDGTSVVVEELTVVGRPLGPALWRVTRGDAEVTILGGMAPLPQQLDWEKSRFERALDQASVLLAPPSGRVGVISAAGFALRMGAVRQPGGRLLEAALPPPLAARFADIRKSLNLGPEPYEHWKPAVAGYLLLVDFRRKAGLSNEKPNSTVVRLAKDKHVAVKTVGDYRFSALFRSLTRLSDAQQTACLSDELDALTVEEAHAHEAADAWAHGDLASARANSSGPILDRCIAQLSSYGEVLERGTADFTAAIDDSLARPGKAVAVIDLRYLLRANGVLDRLKAQGATITVPPE